MKLLLIHADFVEWEPKKKAIASAEEVDKKKVRAEEVLVAFSAVEKADEADPAKIAEKATAEIRKVLDEVKATNVVLYPYAHLSSSLSSPAVALEILKAVEGDLKLKKVKVQRAPFGWYKAFDVKCKGHPLSELSKTITLDGKEAKREGKAVVVEEKFDPKQLLREISKTKLDRDKLKDNDHRILGQKM